METEIHKETAVIHFRAAALLPCLFLRHEAAFDEDIAGCNYLVLYFTVLNAECFDKLNTFLPVNIAVPVEG